MVSLIISILSFVISAMTYWLLHCKHGKVKMTQPTLICVFNDQNSDGKKIFFRTCLFSTAKRGNILETIFVKIIGPNGSQKFDFWGYGDNKNSGRGSGLYIPDIGCVYKHHFSLASKNTIYNFIPGSYIIEVIARVFNENDNIIIKRLALTLTTEHCDIIEESKGQIYFHWDDELKKYRDEIIHCNPLRDRLQSSLANDIGA